MSECAICAGAGGRPQGILAELTSTWVTGAEFAPLPGYVCIVSKRHVEEPFELEAAEGAAFWADCMLVARALFRVFAPRKINYEIHGNTIPHLHLHLYPRTAGDVYEGGSISNRWRFRRSAGELARIAVAIESELGTGSAY